MRGLIGGPGREVSTLIRAFSAGTFATKESNIAEAKSTQRLARAHPTFWPGRYFRAFLSSLRDFLFILAPIPGLKAWAVLGSPSGTAQKVRCARLGKDKDDLLIFIFVFP